jgi:2-oxoglutarate dehydrogenase E2 component (dihydrolipoamide succinyltransferase)
MDSNSVAIRMPDLGDVSRAIVVQWLHPVNSRLNEGDDLLEVETEKTTFVIPAPVAGILRGIMVPEGEGVETGALLGEMEPA